jgi:hypothetical protein
MPYLNERLRRAAAAVAASDAERLGAAFRALVDWLEEQPPAERHSFFRVARDVSHDTSPAIFDLCGGLPRQPADDAVVNNLLSRMPPELAAAFEIL